ncbi:MAG: CDP-glycerol glycerophosphotransferase family protein [Turicibacter sp.]|nr:CDP-glycerol glycerophosphotransferase family protein [Turicibacter sp.]
MHSVKGEIEHISWDKYPNRVYIEGYAYIEGENINRPNKIKKSLVLASQGKRFVVPTNNLYRDDITERDGKGVCNYNFSGFKGFFDLGFISDMGPLEAGEWSIGIYLNTGGIELDYPIPYEGDMKNLSSTKFFKQTTGAGAVECVLKRENNGQVSIIASNGDYVPTGLHASDPPKTATYQALQKMKVYLIKQKQKLGNQFLMKVYEFYKNSPVVANRVLFLSDSRSDLSGNFEFVHKELLKRGGYEIVSFLYPSITAKRSLKTHIQWIKYISTSKFILLDDFYPKIYRYELKGEIELVQLWHATGAFKTFGFSRLGKRGGPAVRSRNHRNYTKALVSSTNIKKYYAEAFGISENRVFATGVPRTDIFFDEGYKENITSQLYGRYPILKEKKVIMFAPTFRGLGQSTAYYDFSQLDVGLLYENLKDEYVLVMKLHPFISEKPEIPDMYQDFVLDLSHEREINDLLFVSDLLITDYSSVCFEYSLLNRPMLFFAYDLEEYIASRDFYYPYEGFVPGPIVKTSKELVAAIKGENFELEKLAGFRERFFDHLDGESTKRVVDLIVGEN